MSDSVSRRIRAAHRRHIGVGAKKSVERRLNLRGGCLDPCLLSFLVGAILGLSDFRFKSPLQFGNASAQPVCVIVFGRSLTPMGGIDLARGRRALWSDDAPIKPLDLLFTLGENPTRHTDSAGA